MAALAAPALRRRHAAGLPGRHGRRAAAGRRAPQGRGALPLPGPPLRLPDGPAVLDPLLLLHPGTALGLGPGTQRPAARLRRATPGQRLANRSAPRPGRAGAIIFLLCLLCPRRRGEAPGGPDGIQEMSALPAVARPSLPDERSPPGRADGFRVCPVARQGQGTPSPGPECPHLSGSRHALDRHGRRRAFGPACCREPNRTAGRLAAPVRRLCERPVLQSSRAPAASVVLELTAPRRAG